MGQFGIGQPVPRSEDPRLLKGAGSYIADVAPDGSLYGYVVRSPFANAHLRIADSARAKAAPGVHAALRSLETPLRCDAVAPVRAHGREDALAVLLVIGDVDHELLEARDRAADALASPLAAALAVGRLAQLDTEVRRLDRLAALGALAAEVAHEIRNPLVTLQTFVQLLPERREDPEFLERYLEVVSDELRRMNRLLDLLVEHAQPPGPVVAMDHARVEPALASLAELLRQRALVRGIALHFDSAPDLPSVVLGGDALHQVLINLAQNALDATPEGGRVDVTAHCTGPAVELCVRDQGPGIDSSQRERIFEPFYSTRSDRPGGIGLAITRRLVEEAGGHIEVEENASGGSCFRVWVPVANPGS